MFKNLTRPNAAFFPFIYVPFLIATIYFALFSGVAWQWWLVSLFTYFLTGCLGVTITNHRLLTHRSFKMPKWCEYLFSWFAAMGGTGSSLGWVAVHRLHHKLSDKDGDPHSPHVSGWKLFFTHIKFDDMDKWSVRELITDPYHRFVHEYYNVLLLIWAVILFLIHPMLFVFGYIVPVVIQVSVSNLSNFFNHYKHWSAYQNYDTNDSSTNSWWLAIIAWGEGWHNNHHADPTNWTFQKKWWELDPSGWVIQLIRTDR